MTEAAPSAAAEPEPRHEIFIDGRPVPVSPEVCREVQRLRARIKEVADEGDRRTAKLQSETAKHRRDMQWAKEWAEQRSFDWMHCSHADALEVARLLAEGDEAGARAFVLERELDAARTAYRNQSRQMARLQQKWTDLVLRKETEGSETAYRELLADIWLYVKWRYVTGKLTTEQRELWADAIETVSERNHPGEGATADRWWRE